MEWIMATDLDGRPILTKRQREMLGFIEGHIQSRGYPPTLREIGNELGIHSTNGVHDHLLALQKKGYIEQRAGTCRTIRVISAAEHAAKRDGK